MSMRQLSHTGVFAVFATVTVVLVCFGHATCNAQGTTFTYQGRLSIGGNPAAGLYDFRFAVFDSAVGGALVGGPRTNIAVAVADGLFTAFLDFGSGVFTGAPRWLEIAVRTNGGGAFTTLAPRQQLTATPYAITAANLSGTLPATQLTGTLPSTVLVGTYGGIVAFTNLGNSFAGNGNGLSNLNAAQLASGIIPDARLAPNIARTNHVWLLSGNAGTVPGMHFLGTTDNQPVEVRVNRTRALRLENNGSGAPNMVAGAPVNFVGSNVVGATIAGGGATNHRGLAYTNSIRGDFGFIGGGLDNTIAAGALAATIAGGAANYTGTNADYAVVCGGLDNYIGAQAVCATISGGYANYIGVGSTDSIISCGTSNTIAADTWGAFIGGGNENYMDEQADFCVIAGGDYNYIGPDAYCSTIAGGGENTIASGAIYAVIPGGQLNYATNYAFAAGHRAKARHTGAFVWGDSTNADIASTNANSVTMRASGGYRLFSNSGATAGVFLAPGGGSWTSISDRNAKENFASVDAQAVLARVVSLPLSTWNYKSQDPSIRHIGPTAQDFYAAFGFGETDTGITSIDADGVALAAIQGLNQKVEVQSAKSETRIQRLEAENAELRERLARLEELVQRLLK